MAEEVVTTDSTAPDEITIQKTDGESNNSKSSIHKNEKEEEQFEFEFQCEFQPKEIDREKTLLPRESYSYTTIPSDVAIVGRNGMVIQGNQQRKRLKKPIEHYGNKNNTSVSTSAQTEASELDVIGKDNHISSNSSKEDSKNSEIPTESTASTTIEEGKSMQEPKEELSTRNRNETGDDNPNRNSRNEESRIKHSVNVTKDAKDKDIDHPTHSKPTSLAAHAVAPFASEFFLQGPYLGPIPIAAPLWLPVQLIAHQINTGNSNIGNGMNGDNNNNDHCWEESLIDYIANYRPTRDREGEKEIAADLVRERHREYHHTPNRNGSRNNDSKTVAEANEDTDEFGNNGNSAQPLIIPIVAEPKYNATSNPENTENSKTAANYTDSIDRKASKIYHDEEASLKDDNNRSNSRYSSSKAENKRGIDEYSSRYDTDYDHDNGKEEAEDRWLSLYNCNVIAAVVGVGARRKAAPKMDGSKGAGYNNNSNYNRNSDDKMK